VNRDTPSRNLKKEVNIYFDFKRYANYGNKESRGFL